MLFILAIMPLWKARSISVNARDVYTFQKAKGQREYFSLTANRVNEYQIASNKNT